MRVGERAEACYIVTIVAKKGGRVRSNLLVGAVLLAALAVGSVAGVSVATGTPDSDSVAHSVYGVEIYETDGAYGTSPIAGEAVAKLRELAAESPEASVTTGDLEFCQEAIERDAVDVACASLLLAHENGDVQPVPGDRSVVHFIACGREPAPGELSTCGRESSFNDDELKQALEAGE